MNISYTDEQVTDLLSKLSHENNKPKFIEAAGDPITDVFEWQDEILFETLSDASAGAMASWTDCDRTFVKVRFNEWRLEL